MALTTQEQAAVDALNALTDADFENGGHRTNFIPALQNAALIVPAAARETTSAAASASAAAASAAALSATSSTSYAISLGSATFATQSGKQFAVGSTILIASGAAPNTNWMVGQITGYSGTTLDVTVTSVGGSGTHTDWQISISGRTGPQGTAGANGSDGATGPTGPTVALTWVFSTTVTDSDPGSGVIRFNNATPASVTYLYFDNNESGGTDITAWLDSLDDSTNSASRGELTLTQVDSSTVFFKFKVAGAVVDGTGYRKIPVAYIAGTALPANGKTLAVIFDRAGDKGADGAGAGDVIGPSSAIDSRIAAFDATTGKLLKDSGAVVGDFLKKDGSVQATGAINWKGAVTVSSATTTDIGAATSNLVEVSGTTTITALGTVAAGATRFVRFTGALTLTHNGTSLILPTSANIATAAGDEAVFESLGSGNWRCKSYSMINGSPLALTAAQTPYGRQAIWIPATAMIANTTNGPAAGSVETSTNKVMIKTLDFDASTIKSAQFMIRMPKSWDEGTVTAVAAWTHAATTTNFKVAWDFSGVAISDGDALDAAFGTVQQVNDIGGTTNTSYVSPESSAITIAGSPQAEDIVCFKVRRKADDATNDTLAINASLLGVTIYLRTDAGNDA